MEADTPYEGQEYHAFHVFQTRSAEHIAWSLPSGPCHPRGTKA